MKKKVYALLVGINDYPIPQHRLRGCVNDVNALREFLEGRCRSENTELVLELLLDDQATRANIIDRFLNHLGKATANDVAMFYYSGHGAQEPAPPEFWYLEPDHLNQTIVCWDSRIDNGKDLADKELSYLISEVAKQGAHTVIIMDCCHSGSGTRDTNPEVRTRQIETGLNYRPLTDFIGHEHYVRSGSEVRVPKGKHIQLAAARSSQTAKETTFEGKQRGVFNYNLVDILQTSQGPLSYTDLMKRVNSRVMGKAMDQNPQVEAIFNAGEGTIDQELNKAFLDGSVATKASYYTITYRNDLNNWTLDAGNVHGIPKSTTPPTVLAIFSDSVSDNDLKDLSKAIGEATVTSTSPEHSIVELSGLDASDKSRTYKAKVKRISVPPIPFLLEGDAKGLEFIREEFKKLNPIYVALTEDKALAKYRIIATDNKYMLKAVGDNRPMVKAIPGYNYVSAAYVLDDLEKVAKWVQTVALSNPGSSVENALEVQMYRVTASDADANPLSYEPIQTTSKITLDYSLQDGQWAPPEFIMSVKNKSQRKLFCAMLYMDSQFGITNDFLKGRWLNPGEEAWVDEKTVLMLGVPDVLAKAGVVELSEVFKFIYSTNEFDSKLYNQEALPLPEDEDAAGTRAIIRKQKAADAADWATYEIMATIVRPQESVKLAANQQVNLQGIKLKAPKGLNVSVSLTSLKQATRGDLNPAEGIAIPAVPSEMANSAQFEQVKFSEGRGTDPGLSVLELTDVMDKNVVDTDNPLEVEIDAPLGDDEYIIPIGTDGEFYFPLGRTVRGAETTVLIERLPDPTPAGTRSLGGSIKILFQKMVASKVGLGNYTYPILAKAEVIKGASFQEDKVDYTFETEQIKAEIARPETQNILLFIHGIIGDTGDMTKSIERGCREVNGTLCSIRSKYDVVLTFDYENLYTKIEDTAGDLKQRLAEVGLKEGHGKTLHIVAHSMGGLVSRWFIEREGGNKIVSHLVMLGTPNAGSPWAKIQDWATMALTMVLSKISLAAWVVSPLVFLINTVDKAARTLDQLNPDSEFFKNLNSSDDPHTPYTIISGNTTMIEHLAEQTTKATMKRMISKVSSGELQEKVLTDFIFGTPNDVAVSVKSIKGVNLERDPMPTPVDVACDHMSYFSSERGLQMLSEVLFTLCDQKKTLDVKV